MTSSMMQMGLPSAVIFDCDGTLADTEPIAEAALVTPLARHGYAMTVKDRRAVAGRDFRDTYEYFRRIHPTLPVLDIVRRSFLNDVLTALPDVSVYPDAIETLTALKAADVPLAVVSSSERLRLDATLRAAGFLGLFSVSVAGDEVEVGKPSPMGYLLAARRLGVSPRDCVVAEDTAVGVQAALAAGMKVVGIRRLSGDIGPATCVVPKLGIDVVRAAWATEPGIADSVDLPHPR